jgi:predicted PurR-regulated permease PerM
MRVAHTSRDSQIASVAGWALLVALVYVIYRVVAPLLSPLGWAAVFAIVVHPLYVRLARHWGSSGAALVSTLAVAVALVVPAVADCWAAPSRSAHSAW